MTDELERRWDDAVEKAWSEFRQRLGDRLAELGADESVVVELPQDDELEGATPYCQALAYGDQLRVEAVSNEFLDRAHALDETGEQAMRELGFALPQPDASPNYWTDLEQREADLAAVMMVRALREVYGVLHPIYLDAGGLEPQPREPESDPGEAADADRTTFAENADEVRAALDAALAPVLGHAPHWDEDGDLPIMTERSVLYLTIAQSAPRILMHATLVVDVVDEQRALSEVNLLNQAEFGLTFVLAERRITVRRELPVAAFVPEVLRAEIKRVGDSMDRWVSELVTRVGGRDVFSDEAAQSPQAATPPSREADGPHDERLQQALRVLRELESEERGSVDPSTMLRIFHGDRDLLLAAIRHSLARANKWGVRLREAEKEGRTATAKLSRARQRYYHGLRARQRSALRLAVQAPAKPDRQEQLTLFPEDEAIS
ncbi:TY-Chap domain-containing protein [Nocardioides coralli]|uniref:TY-Chap domain-containing protein n=1 Tax=Nocardioides coralli TaxID=2872154 RepID=UPI001CA415A3|nr:hypothetical protein [Nocardioides coralli]QZY29699.1 hypothetical protein K6T13_03120 [Nocardioides coralli]